MPEDGLADLTQLIRSDNSLSLGVTILRITAQAKKRTPQQWLKKTTRKQP
jgi:hypothetical protein